MADETRRTLEQHERVCERIAMAAQLTATSLRLAAQHTDLLARENVLHTLAMAVDTIGAMADGAIGFPTNGSADAWLYGSDFDRLGRG